MGKNRLKKAVVVLDGENAQKFYDYLSGDYDTLKREKILVKKVECPGENTDSVIYCLRVSGATVVALSEYKKAGRQGCKELQVYLTAVGGSRQIGDANSRLEKMSGV